MATPIISCPGCGSELDATALSCPICMRPRTRKEILRDLQGTRDAHAAQRRRPTLYLALLIIAALSAVTAREYLRRNTAAARPSAGAAADIGDRPVSAPPQTRTPAAVLATQAPAAPEPSPAPPANLPPPPEQGPPPLPEGQWQMYGLVYDLFSLQNVNGATVIFTDASTDAKFSVKTNPKGRYRLRVPRADSGYAVTIRHPRYRSEYLEDGEPPLRARSEARREQAAYEAAQSAVLHVPVTADPESREARYDLVLIPKE